MPKPVSRGKTRPYRMRRRAEEVDRTRLRITEAAMRLHTSVGPSGASLSAIAAEAGVTRVTLYRHFPSAEELFTTCMAHWQALNPPPAGAPWMAIPDFGDRVRRALVDLYRWYAAHGEDLYPMYRDSGFTPPSNQAARRAIPEQIAGLLLTGTSLPPTQARRIRAALVHAVAFMTWRSLTTESALSTGEAADMAAHFVLGQA